MTDRRTRRASRATGHLLPLGLWAAAVVLFFWPLLSGRAHIANGDFSGQFHAFGLFQMRELAAGRFPLWSPGSFGGFPFAADPQAAAFYPLRWLTLLLSLPWRFPYHALQLEAVAHVWLAGAFIYLLAYDLTRRRAAALLAAFAFGLGGYLTSYPILQLAILETIAWLPLALLLLRRAVTGQRPLPYLVAAALVLALAATAGHPQTFLHVAYTAAAYYLFLALRRRWPWAAILKSGLLVIVIVAGAAAVAWLPAASYVAGTERAAVGYEFVSSGVPLVDYFQAVAPGAWTLWSPPYIGLAGLLFAAAALLGLPAAATSPAAGGVTRAEILFWGGVALVAAWLSLGDSGILFELAYRVAPGFSLFRQQERLAGIVSFALALLAAQGFALWQSRAGDGRSFPRRVAAARPVLVVGGLLLLAGITLAAMGEQAGDAWRAGWARQWLILVPLALLFVARRSSVAATAGVLALLLVDLFLAVNPAQHLAPGSPSVYWPQPDWLEPLAADGDSRFDSQNLFHANTGEIYELQDIRGISPLKPSAVAAYEDLPRPLRWQLLNVTHVLAPEPLEPGLTPLMPATQSIIPGQTLDATLYRFEDARPRAWLSTEPLFAPDAGAALARLQAPDFDPARQVVLLAAAAPQVEGIAPTGDPGEVIIRHVPRGLDLTVDSGAAAFLVISEFYRSGWRVTIDGEAAPLLEANAGLMAVPLPAGSHAVALRFRPLDVPAGAAISLLTLAAAGVVLWRRRAAGAMPDPAAEPASLPFTGEEEEGPPGMVSWGLNVAERRIGLGLMAAILLLGFGLRVYHLGHQELRGDEAFSYNFTQYDLREVMPQLIAQGDPHPPLHYLLLNIWAGAAGDSELALRYLSAVAGVLFLAVLYALGRRMGGRAGGLATGLIAAGLAAFSPGLVWLSQDARNQYALVLVFASVATLLIVTPPRRVRGYWGFYLIACVLTAYTHYYGVLALAGHGLYLWLAPGRRRDLLPWAATGLLAAAALGVWLVAASSGVLTAGQLADPAQPDLARHLTALGRDLVAGQSLDGRAARWLFVLFAGLAVGGYAALVRSGRAAWAAMLAAWVFLGAYTIFLVRFSRGTFNSFYGSVVAPAWWLLVSAAATAWLRHDGWRRATMGLLLLAYLVAAGLSLRNYYIDPQFGRSLGYREVVAHLARQAGPDDILIIPYPDPAWDYYLRHSDLTRHMLPAALGETAAATEATLAGWATRYDRFWFIPYTGWDSDDVVGRWLDYHTLREEQTRQSRLNLFAYRPLAAAAAAMTPIDQPVNDEFRLAAALVTIDGQPADLDQPNAAAPGAALEVTLLWEGMRPAARGYTVFVHVLDAGGALLAQHDGIPAYGTRPMPTWQPGEQLLDRHELTLPPEFNGPATIVVGLYDSGTLAPQPFAGGQTTLPLAGISPQP